MESEAAIGNQITARCDECSKSSATRKPDVGNPHVRFEEGEGTRRSLANAFHSVRPSLLYFRAFLLHLTEGSEGNEAGLYKPFATFAIFCSELFFLTEGSASSP
jgi:hypothetical protein